MKVLYCRVSTIDQNTDRQKEKRGDYDRVIEDKCSGSVPFFDRDGGKRIMFMISNNELSELHVLSIDRLGRDLLDILNTIKLFNTELIPISFISQGLVTMVDGKENSIAKLIIGVLGTVAEMERNQIKERQETGIKIAKAKGAYKGRKEGTKEDILAFLSKPHNKLALELLNKGYRCKDAAKVAEVNINTVTKIKRLGVIPSNTPVS